MSRHVIVIGAGIVGTSVARELLGQGAAVTVLDRWQGSQKGSTAFAPGFVGLYNESPVLTDLATSSARIYSQYGEGVRCCGGLELATAEAAGAAISQRVQGARAAGLDAALVDPAELPEAVTAFVDLQRIITAGWYPEDVAADVPVLLNSLVRRAVEDGADFRWGQDVVSIKSSEGRTSVETAAGDRFVGDDVVLAAGVWGSPLAASVGLDLPLIPVSHPYVYSGADERWNPGPFVRFPEHHVYARVHGDRLGLGSYDHRPVPVDQAQISDGAGLEWDPGFDDVITSAQDLLVPEARFEMEERVNGVFGMTPDNLPFLGPHPSMEGVWIAQALWVTHAAGAAEILSQVMSGGEEPPEELRVDRFTGLSPERLEEQALRLYRDIYANEGEPTGAH